MRAIQQAEFGGPEVLELVELPAPEPGDGEVLIEVRRAGLNFADTHQREDQYVQRQALPLIPGSEVAGVRADTGERVVALCGHGGYAEYAVAPADRVFPIPGGLDDGTALALLLQGLTAWHLYRTCARMAEGESVLVVSGAGGVGSLAVQLGHALGAGRVVATASSEEKRALCLELGADAAIDGATDGLEERILEANGGRGVDVVLEMAGGPVFDASLRAMTEMGRLVVYGISSREQNEVRTGRLLKRSQSIIGFWLFHYLERREHLEQPLAELFGLAAEGRVRAVVGGTYPLADARQAQEDLAGRRTTGKLLLDPTA
jgi:NADPH2:quinone reductase